MRRQAPENTLDTSVALLDRVISCGLWIPEAIVGELAGRAADAAGLSRVVYKPRIGQNGQEFMMPKARTEDEDGEPLNWLCGKFEDTGANEVKQKELVVPKSRDIPSTMRIRGWRPLAPDDHSDFLDALDTDVRDKWLKFVLPTKPGIISSFGVLAHCELGSNYLEYRRKAALDIKDETEPQPFLRLRLASKLASNAIGQVVDLATARVSNREAA